LDLEEMTTATAAVKVLGTTSAAGRTRRSDDDDECLKPRLSLRSMQRIRAAMTTCLVRAIFCDLQEDKVSCSSGSQEVTFLRMKKMKSWKVFFEETIIEFREWFGYQVGPSPPSTFVYYMSISCIL